MDQNLDLKDLRVPTFIPFDVDDKKVKKTTKRKRAVQPDSKPNKRKVKKVTDKDAFAVADVKEENPKKENEVWVGAAVDEKYGAYEIYFGENDERNFNQVFEKENELQDIDYAYVLGALKAVESLKSTATPFIVNTTCRDLPRALAGRGKNFHYSDLSDKIRDAIKESGNDIQVRHLSGRTSTADHKIAMALAQDALELHLKSKENIIEEKIVEEKTVIEEKSIVEEKLIIEEPVEVLKEDVKVVEKTILNEDTSANVENQVDNLTVGEKKQNIDEITTTTTTTTVTTEVTLETKVDIIVSENEANGEDMELDQKSVEEAPSSWASKFGIRNLLDILYAPFKTRKSS